MEWNTILNFAKNPVYQEDTNTDLKYRLIILSRLLMSALTISIFLGMLIGGLKTAFHLDLGKHALDDFMAEYSALTLLLAAVILAPFFEELLFRGPLYFFRNSQYFNYAFYSLTLIFGFYHITNFELTATTLALAPLLVLPQMSIGVFLGFVRVRFGLPWAMAFHAVYNFVLVTPMLILHLLEIPVP
ncbi:CPBP family intramembrane glutamic endopeptidase [Pareuzebyella sediminis]|nr:CPBP family intramembrane glutamic endopeptidase [Pareuzebyella sediminis]